MASESLPLSIRLLPLPLLLSSWADLRMDARPFSAFSGALTRCLAEPLILLRFLVLPVFLSLETLSKWVMNESLVWIHLTVASRWKRAIFRRSVSGPRNMVTWSVFLSANVRQYVLHRREMVERHKNWRAASQVFINSHKALAQMVVQQGPAYQSRPTFKLYHSDYASSGIWTVGSKSR